MQCRSARSRRSNRRAAAAPTAKADVRLGGYTDQLFLPIARRISLAMNPTYHVVRVAELLPCPMRDGAFAPNMFNLSLWYRNSDKPDILRYVYVPESIQNEIHASNARCIYIETVEFGGRVWELIAGRPHFVVTSISTTDQQGVKELPAAIHRAAVVDNALGLLGCVVGVSLIYFAQPWLGAGALLMGTHRFQAAARLPSLPFCGRQAPSMRLESETLPEPP